MKKKLLALATVVMVLGVAGVSGATVFTYINQALWEAAVGNTIIYDLESDMAAEFTSKDFGVFTAKIENPTVALPGFVVDEANKYLRKQGYDHESELLIEFDLDINSVGFDRENTDESDSKEFMIDPEDPLPPESAGFFGII